MMSESIQTFGYQYIDNEKLLLMLLLKTFFSSTIYVFMVLSYIHICFQTGVKFIEDQYFDHMSPHGVSEINQFMSLKRSPIYLRKLNVLMFKIQKIRFLMYVLSNVFCCNISKLKTSATTNVIIIKVNTSNMLLSLSNRFQGEIICKLIANISL